MGTPQLMYGARARGVAGQLAYGKVRGIVESKVCGTSAGIEFGRIVSRGSSDDICVVGGNAPFGVALFDQGQGMNEDSEGRYEYKSSVSVIDKDYVLLNTASVSGAYRAKVYYLIADSTPGAGDIGTIVVTDAPTENHRLIGYLGQTLNAAGLVKVYVDTDLYYFEVAAAAAGDAAADLVVAALTDDIRELQEAVDLVVAPAAVTALSAAVGNAQSVVTWVDPVDTDLAHIVVEIAATATGIVASSRRVAAAAGTVTITGLSNGTEYTVYVWAVDTDGNYSEVVTDTVTPSAG